MCQHVTVCGFMSVAKQEVCGVKVAFRKLDVVHYRQDFTSKRRLKIGDKEFDEFRNQTNSMVAKHTITRRLL